MTRRFRGEPREIPLTYEFSSYSLSQLKVIFEKVMAGECPFPEEDHTHEVMLEKVMRGECPFPEKDRLDDAQFKLYADNFIASAELARAKTLYEKNELSSVFSALHLFRNVTIRQPENPEGFEGLGMVYTFFKQYDVAKKFFDKASALRGNALNGQEFVPPAPGNE